jgi:hypothetical protein
MRTISLIPIAFFLLLSLISCGEDMFDRVRVSTDRSSYVLGDTAHIRIVNDADDSLTIGACHGHLSFGIDGQIGTVWMEGDWVNILCSDDSPPYVSIGPGRTFQQDFAVDDRHFSHGECYQLWFKCYFKAERGLRLSNEFHVR